MNNNSNERILKLELIKSKKIFIATPMYGQSAMSNYIISIIDLIDFCSKNEISITFRHIGTEALISRARNELVYDFLQTDCDYLFFIDSDISFNKYDFLYTVQLAIENYEMNIITAAYTQKQVHWEEIKKAFKNNKINNYIDYGRYGGKFGVNLVNWEDFQIYEPQEAIFSSTGFMLIDRKVFNDFSKFFKDQHYLASKQGHSKEKKNIVAFFDTKIDEETKEYLSEDYMFCKYVREIGYKVWVLPWVKLDHMGTYLFTSNFADQSMLNNIK
jgi:hypothetical protein